MNIKRRVNNLIKKHSTRNPFKIAKDLNINIIYEDLGGIKGYFKNILGNKFIVINSNLDEFSQLVICSHELGHCLLHTTKGIKFMKENTLLFNSSKIETQANIFAAELLIDDNCEYNDYEINNALIGEITLKKLYKLKYYN